MPNVLFPVHTILYIIIYSICTELQSIQKSWLHKILKIILKQFNNIELNDNIIKPTQAILQPKHNSRILSNSNSTPLVIEILKTLNSHYYNVTIARNYDMHSRQNVYLYLSEHVFKLDFVKKNILGEMKKWLALEFIRKGVIILNESLDILSPICHHVLLPSKTGRGVLQYCHNMRYKT